MSLINNKEVIDKIKLFRNSSIDFSEDIENQIYQYKNTYKVIVFEFGIGPHSVGYYALLFDKQKPLPSEVNDEKNLLLNIEGKWKRKNTLGICDGCGQYEELIHHCYSPKHKSGHFCKNCSKIEI